MPELLSSATYDCDAVVRGIPPTLAPEAFATDFDFMSALHRAVNANTDWQGIQLAAALESGASTPRSPVDLTPATPLEVHEPHSPQSGIRTCESSEAARAANALAGLLATRLLAIQVGLESGTPTCIAVRKAVQVLVSADGVGDGFASPPLTPEELSPSDPGSGALSPDVPLHAQYPVPLRAASIAELASTPPAGAVNALAGHTDPACSQSAGSHLVAESQPILQPPVPGVHAARNRLKKLRRAAKSAAAASGNRPGTDDVPSQSRSQDKRERLKARLVTVSTGAGELVTTMYKAQQSAKKKRQRSRSPSPTTSSCGKPAEPEARPASNRHARKRRARSRTRLQPVLAPSPDSRTMELPENPPCVDCPPSSAPPPPAAGPSSSRHKPTRRNPHKKLNSEKKQARAGYAEQHAAESARRRHEAKARMRSQGGVWGTLHGADYERARRAYRVIALDQDGSIALSHCRNGFIGHRPDGHRKNIGESRTKEELDADGFWGLEWDGKLTYVFLDIRDTIIIVAVGAPAEDDERPPEERWSGLMKRIPELFESQRVAHKEAFEGENGAGSRGPFAAVNFGFSMGMGQGAPKDLGFKHAAHGEVAEALKQSEDLQRAAKHGSEALATWFPLPYYHLRRAMRKLSAHDPSVAPPFTGSVYPTACANLGPRTCCRWHHDVNNYPGLPCWILALGDFDPKLGGHLVLPQLRIYIEFPAGASILLSSAGIKHGNTPVGPNEKRYSFTQYCPGGLLRYVAYGFRLARDVKDPKLQRELEEEAGETWKQQYGRFSKSAGVVQDREWVRRQEEKESAV